MISSTVSDCILLRLKLIIEAVADKQRSSQIQKLILDVCVLWLPRSWKAPHLNQSFQAEAYKGLLIWPGYSSTGQYHGQLITGLIKR